LLNRLTPNWETLGSLEKEASKLGLLFPNSFASGIMVSMEINNEAGRAFVRADQK
jgi:hypothetical protein